MTNREVIDVKKGFVVDGGDFNNLVLSTATKLVSLL